MRTLHFLAFAAVATVSVSACANPSINAADATVNVQAARVHHLTPDEARHMKGTFLLDDGRVMKLTNQRTRLFVDLDGKQEELVPVGPQDFVTRQSGNHFAFNQVPFADEVVINPAAR
jgi:hypothetical protein